jgi:outer membrane lipoprotein-sorting protein
MIQQRHPQFEEAPMVIKVVIDNRGRIRMDVVRPLIKEGVVAVDDGKEIRTYHPDLHVLQVAESPLVSAPSPIQRARLLEANYTLDLENGPRVAGRSTLQLHLRPRHERLEEQVLFLDREKFTTLRVEARDGEDTRVLADTLHIEYSNHSASFSPPAGTSIVREPRPVPLERSGDGKAKLGFKPSLPRRLPFGFQTQSSWVIGAKDRPYLRTRVSDGLLAGSVYQWSSRVQGGRHPVGLNPMYSRGGVNFAVYGELPPDVARTVLSTFVLKK